MEWWEVLFAVCAIDGIEVVSVLGGAPDDIEAFAKDRGIAHATKGLAKSLAHPAIEAVILATPTHGPIHDELGIAMDMSASMKAKSGDICTVSLSFNNGVRFSTFFRYICDDGTYTAHYDDPYDGHDKQIDLTGVAVSNNGIELIDREFFSAIQKVREPNGSVAQCQPAMETLNRIKQSFGTWRVQRLCLSAAASWQLQLPLSRRRSTHQQRWPGD